MKKYLIKIPKNIKIIYSRKKKTIILIGILSKKLLKLKVQLFVINFKSSIQISTLPFLEMSINKQKKTKIYQKTTVALIKQCIVETSAILYQKLKLVGIGYRILNLDNLNNKLLLFKLGFSHFLYFKIPTKLKIFCLKLTKLFVSGNSYQNITQITSLIRSCKKPEPYKSKGILYENEKIILKKGKKT
jgi:large subunit ribosomal protein L6